MLGFEAAGIIESVGEENIKILVSRKDARTLRKNKQITLHLGAKNLLT
jgi:Zn-dependent alcohol dehydrogenase